MIHSMKTLLKLAFFGLAASGPALALNGCATGVNEDSTYSVADDHRLENDILRAIRQDAGLVGDRINVRVESRMVTITGRVSNRIHVNRIERILKDFDDEIRGYNIELEDARGRLLNR